MKFNEETFEYLNPEDYGINKRQKIIRVSDDEIGIVKLRKSRIIMKDGKQIIQISEAIKSKNSKLKVNLIISGPICSKTTKYLNENNINIICID